jgi:hypothetical protein
VAFKNFKVYFARTSVGKKGISLAPLLRSAVDRHGQNLPAITVSNELFQFRDLQRVGTVWSGTFGKLRDDAPNIVAANGKEEELDLEEGDHLLEKCHFLYRERENLFVWQANRTAGGFSRVQAYLSELFEMMVALPQVMNDAELEKVLAGQLYEIDFSYERPMALPGDAARWNKDAFDMMAGVDAAHAKFSLRAPRRGGLAEAAKHMVRQLVGAPGTEKIRVRLTDESDPYELFMAPLKDSIRVELTGRYPRAHDVFRELESAYDRQHANISVRAIAAT